MSIKEQIWYDQKTGKFIWTVDKANRKAGDVAGHLNKTNGYHTVMIDYKVFYGHRLAVWFMTEEFPPKGAVVDHINGDKSDNRWANLRVTNQSINAHNRIGLNKNNTSGAAGVYQLSSGKWQAKVVLKYKQVYVGTFLSRAGAISAREAFRVQKGLL